MTNPLAKDLDHVLAHTETLWETARGEHFFITGGTAFVGSWLLESLLWANRRLNLRVSATLLTRDAEKFRLRRPHLADAPEIRVHQGDCVDFAFPSGSFPFVIHAASGRYIAPTPESPTSMFDKDIVAVRRVLDLARERHTRRFLFTSSGAVYGKQSPDCTHVPEDCAGAPLPTSTDAAYGHMKRTAEFLSCCYSRSYEFDVLIARLFAFTGPYLPLDENFAVGNFIADVLAGGPVRIHGDGTPYRSYLYAADLAIWLWTILFRGNSRLPYNVGSSEPISVADVARTVVAHSVPGTRIHVARQPDPSAHPERYVPSIARAAGSLGLQVWIPFEEGIRRMWLWNKAVLENQVPAKEYRAAKYADKVGVS